MILSRASYLFLALFLFGCAVPAILTPQDPCKADFVEYVNQCRVEVLLASEAKRLNTAFNNAKSEEERNAVRRSFYKLDAQRADYRAAMGLMSTDPIQAEAQLNLILKVLKRAK